jgi:hypothetical protein
MTAEQNQSRLWYVRRAGRERGPFPPGQITREILLGRIQADDELSQDRQTWKPMSAVPQLHPETMRQAGGANGQRLLLARLREDERSRERRRPGAAEARGEPRRGDRRNVESFDTLARRATRARWVDESGPEERNLLVPAAVVMTMFFVLALYFLWYRPAPAPAARDCAAAPAARINWNHCAMPGRDLGRADLQHASLANAVLTRADLHAANLARADLSYADLEGAGLRDANLQGANLKGAVLRNADLSQADLRHADLGFAALQGANLDGAQLADAKLDRTIWTDGRVCAPGSVGECR